MNSLNPVHTVGAQLMRICRLHNPGLQPDAVRQRVIELLTKTGLASTVIGAYPHQLSGGMRQRVVIAMSMLASPTVLIADEATTALDVIVEREILRELSMLRRSANLALIVISHDIEVISQICDRVAVMYAGQIVEIGPTRKVFDKPRHPYTAGLLGALPDLHGPRRRLVGIPGTPPQLQSIPASCRFQPRCPLATQVCSSAPALTADEGSWAARCHFAGAAAIQEIREGRYGNADT
jgi:oligopeptide/dipeptide ABC transporter ATP-binding protein